MSSSPNPFASADPFVRFWSDAMSKFVPGAAPAAPAPDALEQLRRSFFDALAQSADQFMRSEAFLQAMKQSMDNSLAWQKQVNQFVQQGLSSAQMPGKADNEQIVAILRGLDQKINARLDELSQRVEALEQGASRARNKAEAKGEK